MATSYSAVQARPLAKQNIYIGFLKPESYAKAQCSRFRVQGLRHTVRMTIT